MRSTVRPSRRPGAAVPPTRAMSARIPPSPRLSARITNDMYLNVTTKVIAQITSERTPRTFSGVAGTECGPSKHSLSA